MTLSQFLSRVGATDASEAAFAQVKYCADWLRAGGCTEAASVLATSLDPLAGAFNVVNEFRKRCYDVDGCEPTWTAVDQAAEIVRQALSRLD